MDDQVTLKHLSWNCSWNQFPTKAFVHSHLEHWGADLPASLFLWEGEDGLEGLKCVGPTSNAAVVGVNPWDLDFGPQGGSSLGGTTRWRWSRIRSDSVHRCSAFLGGEVPFFYGEMFFWHGEMWFDKFSLPWQESPTVRYPVFFCF